MNVAVLIARPHFTEDFVSGLLAEFGHLRRSNSNRTSASVMATPFSRVRPIPTYLGSAGKRTDRGRRRPGCNSNRQPRLRPAQTARRVDTNLRLGHAAAGSPRHSNGQSSRLRRRYTAIVRAIPTTPAYEPRNGSATFPQQSLFSPQPRSTIRPRRALTRSHELFRPGRIYPSPSRSYCRPSYSPPSRGYIGGGGGSRVGGGYSGGGGGSRAIAAAVGWKPQHGGGGGSSLVAVGGWRKFTWLWRLQLSR